MIKHYIDILERRIKKPLFQKRLLRDVFACSATAQKKALLIYLSMPFWISKKNNYRLSHTNLNRVVMIAEELNARGFQVDVLDISARAQQVTERYDLIIGIDRLYNEIAGGADPDTVKIRLTAGMEPRLFNAALKKRVDEIKQATGVELPMTRHVSVDPDNLRYLQISDALFCLGNEYTASTFAPYFEKPIITFPNHGFGDLAYMPTRKTATTKKHFLFFSGGGKVFLGLDLLLKAFANRSDAHLHICTCFKNEKEFESLYEKELYHTDNIHFIGRIVVGGDQFKKVVEECNYVIVPQCGGASNGSVVVCMHFGLIPVVTKQAGLDIDGCGVLLKDHTQEVVDETITSLLAQPDEWIEEHSRLAYETALSEYSNDAFRRRFNHLLDVMQ